MEEDSTPQFSSILSARANDGRPSGKSPFRLPETASKLPLSRLNHAKTKDLEYLLRSHCQRLRVVQNLSGAHLMINAEQSIAVRAYFSYDLDALSKETGETTTTHCDDIQTNDFDGLSSFLKFKVSIILFILPVEEQRRQLGDLNSFFHRSQRIVATHAKKNQDKIARVFLLSSAEAGVDALKAIAKALSSTSQIKRAKYHEKQHGKYFLPQPTHIPIVCREAAAMHVAEAFRDMGVRFEFPPDETDVILSILGTLGNTASANDTLLASIPIDRRSKTMLQLFFGTMSKDQESVMPPSVVHQVEDSIGHEASLQRPTLPACIHYRQATTGPLSFRPSTAGSVIRERFQWQTNPSQMQGGYHSTFGSSGNDGNLFGGAYGEVPYDHSFVPSQRQPQSFMAAQYMEREY